MIVIDGKPIPKSRVRFGMGRAYNSQSEAMNRTRLEIKQQYKSEPLSGAVRLTIGFYMPIPKSGKRWDKITQKKVTVNEEAWHTNKPDADNMMKYIKDCMSGIVYDDDRQVCDERAMKLYSKNPRTEIIVEEL